MIEYLKFLFLATNAFRIAKNNGKGIYYGRRTVFGETQACIMVATGRRSAMVEKLIQKYFDPEGLEGEEKDGTSKDNS